jgi:hypothetical protein
MKAKDLLNYDGCSFAAEINGTPPVVGVIAIKDGFTYLCQDKTGSIRPEIKSKGYKYSWNLGASNREDDLEDLMVTNFRLLLSGYWRVGDILQKDGGNDLEIVFCKGELVVCVMIEYPSVNLTYTCEELRKEGWQIKKSAKTATPPQATPSELELRKWALEMSLEHANKLFPQRDIKRPSEYMSNAHRIIKLVTEEWDNQSVNLDACLPSDRLYPCPTVDKNP